MKKDLIQFLSDNYDRYKHDPPISNDEIFLTSVVENAKYIYKKSVMTEFNPPNYDTLENDMKNVILHENHRPDWVDRPDLVGKFVTRYVNFLTMYQENDKIFFYDMFPYLPFLSGRAGLIITDEDFKIKAHHLIVVS